MLWTSNVDCNCRTSTAGGSRRIPARFLVLSPLQIWYRYLTTARVCSCHRLGVNSRAQTHPFSDLPAVLQICSTGPSPHRLFLRNARRAQRILARPGPGYANICRFARVRLRLWPSASAGPAGACRRWQHTTRVWSTLRPRSTARHGSLATERIMARKRQRCHLKSPRGQMATVMPLGDGPRAARQFPWPRADQTVVTLSTRAAGSRRTSQHPCDARKRPSRHVAPRGQMLPSRQLVPLRHRSCGELTGWAQKLANSRCASQHRFERLARPLRASGRLAGVRQRGEFTAT